MAEHPADQGGLYAISDLHVGYAANRAHVDTVRAVHPDDWLIVAGDVAENPRDLRRVLQSFRERFARVVWAPGNHELWTHPRDPITLRGADRYQLLVELCRELDVISPEDPYPVFTGAEGPLRVASLFTLYDYSFRVPQARTAAEALARAERAGVVCRDEYVLHPDPYPSRADWCHARVELTERRLAECDPEVPLVLVNHWPLVREPTELLRYPDFAQWCGTSATADWHRRFDVAAVVYGHLHIPRRTVYDGVPFHEVSVGYPREWQRRGATPPGPTRVTVRAR